MHKRLCLVLDTKGIEYIVKEVFIATHLHRSSGLNSEKCEEKARAKL